MPARLTRNRPPHKKASCSCTPAAHANQLLRHTTRSGTPVAQAIRRPRDSRPAGVLVRATAPARAAVARISWMSSPTAQPGTVDSISFCAVGNGEPPAYLLLASAPQK